MTPDLLRAWLLSELRRLSEPLDLDTLVADGKLSHLSGRRYVALVNLLDLPLHVLDLVEVIDGISDPSGRTVLTFLRTPSLKSYQASRRRRRYRRR
jgi:hypothetical protein